MVVVVLYVGKQVLMPIALSILLAFVLNPIVLVLEHRRIGRIGSVIIASFLAFLAIGASWGLAGQLSSLAKDLPNHEQEIKTKLAALRMDETSTFGRLNTMLKEVTTGYGSPSSPTEPSATEPSEGDKSAHVVIAREESSQMSAAVEFLFSAVEPFAMTAIVIVLVLFVLIRREDIRYRVISLMGDHALTGTTRLMQDTAERVSNYLFHLLLVNAAFGLWFAIGLYLMKVPYAPLWGFLTLFLRFIPFLGSPASVIFPLLISVATSTGWSQPGGILIFFAISELLTANVIEPILFGKSTGLTPIALLVAALFWAWIWGPIGLFLSTPMTVCLVVLGQHLPALRSLKVLLAEQPVLDAKLQYFQRLLAKDDSEAEKLVKDTIAKFGIESAIDEVLLPALRWTRKERQKESITSEEENFIYASMRETFNRSVLELPNKTPVETASDNQETIANDLNPKPSVVGYPVHHESEELALTMLQTIASDCCSLSLISTKQLPSIVIKGLEKAEPQVVVLTVIPPGGLSQVKYICTELHKSCPNTSILIAFLGEVRNYDSLLVRMRKAGASYLATSLSQTRQMIVALCDEKLQIGSESQNDRQPTNPTPHLHLTEKQAPPVMFLGEAAHAK